MDESTLPRVIDCMRDTNTGYRENDAYDVLCRLHDDITNTEEFVLVDEEELCFE